MPCRPTTRYSSTTWSCWWMNKGEKESVEVHIFDFNDDIYGKHVKIRFVKKIREEQKFKDLETLKHQIQIDEKEIRELLLTL